ncbi:D(2) dopamine receptor-like [Actinia tenebrosa]|uniref:D(2) dopamine receptor-like n=1 Tax=Actinia tenebrosa TaxID=6105 RepID=A0A6P8HDQ3_ACTTE|nr:D(2) dopamine receptor-like [Actinia tenebrosa]
MSNFTSNTRAESECLLPLEHGIILIILNIISSVFGSIGNLLVCATIYTTTGLQTISNYFLVSMAVADLIVTVVAQPLLVGFLGAAIDGSCANIVELLFRLAANISCAVSVIHLCFISVDRCLMVTKPHNFSRIMTKMRSRILLLISWVLPIIYAVLRLKVSKRATSLFTVAMMAVCYMVIVISYTLIIIQVRKQQNLMQSRQTAYSAGNSKRKRDQMERRVAMTIGIVIIVFTISWLPILVLRSLNADKNSGTAYNWARTLALCNSAMNPWIYCYRIPEFRAAYRRLFILCRWGQVKGSGLGEAETTMTSESATRNQDVHSFEHDNVPVDAGSGKNQHSSMKIVSVQPECEQSQGLGGDSATPGSAGD